MADDFIPYNPHRQTKTRRPQKKNTTDDRPFDTPLDTCVVSSKLLDTATTDLNYLRDRDSKYTHTLGSFEDCDTDGKARDNIDCKDDEDENETYQEPLSPALPPRAPPPSRKNPSQRISTPASPQAPSHGGKTPPPPSMPTESAQLYTANSFSSFEQQLQKSEVTPTDTPYHLRDRNSRHIRAPRNHEHDDADSVFGNSRDISDCEDDENEDTTYLELSSPKALPPRNPPPSRDIPGQRQTSASASFPRKIGNLQRSIQSQAPSIGETSLLMADVTTIPLQQGCSYIVVILYNVEHVDVSILDRYVQATDEITNRCIRHLSSAKVLSCETRPAVVPSSNSRLELFDSFSDYSNESVCIPQGVPSTRQRWSKEEDKELRKLRAQKCSWSTICENFPDRSSGAVKARWYTKISGECGRGRGRGRNR